MYDSFHKILAVFVNYNSLLQMSFSIQVEKNTCSYLQFKSVDTVRWRFLYGREKRARM